MPEAAAPAAWVLAAGGKLAAVATVGVRTSNVAFVDITGVGTCPTVFWLTADVVTELTTVNDSWGAEGAGMQETAMAKEATRINCQMSGAVFKGCGTQHAYVVCVHFAVSRHPRKE